MNLRELIYFLEFEWVLQWFVLCTKDTDSWKYELLVYMLLLNIGMLISYLYHDEYNENRISKNLNDLFFGNV